MPTLKSKQIDIFIYHYITSSFVNFSRGRECLEKLDTVIAIKYFTFIITF